MKMKKFFTTFKRKLAEKRKSIGFIQGLAIGLASTSLLTWAAVTIPHTFTANTTISATEVNANFTALKTAVDDMNIKFIGTLASNHLISTCVSTPVYPGDFDIPTWQSGGGPAGSFTIPVSGVYEIAADFTYTMSGSGYVTGKLDINGTPESINTSSRVIRNLNNGDVVKIGVACNDKSGFGTDQGTLDSTKAYFIVKKL